MDTLEDRLASWVGAGLITPDQAAEVRRYEAEHGREPEDGGGAAEAAPEIERTRPLALVGEVVGYLGAVLVVSAVSFLLRQTWTDLPDPGRIAIVAALLAVVATGGTLAARVRTDPAQRLASVLLVATVGLTGWLAFVIADVADVSDEAMGIAVFAPAAAVAAVIYTLRRRGLAQVATLIALGGLATSAVSTALTDRDVAFGIGITLAALGALWVLGGATGALRPGPLAMVTGGLVTVLAIQSTAYDDLRTWMLVAATAIAVAMIVLAVTVARLAVLIVPGGVGLLVSTPQLIDHVVGDAMATWVGVLVTGVALVVAAVWMVRRRRPTGG